MSNAHGTDWTAPGEGATVNELLNAVEKAEILRTHQNAGCGNSYWSRWTGRELTNLRLTGRPLVAYDLERIAACEVAK